MRKKFYIMSFDRGGILDSFDYKRFHNLITTAKGIDAWWHYLESTYILKVDSHITASNISEFIMTIAANKKFFVCELNLSNRNGWLPKEAWDWLNEKQNYNS
jgi:hypothetical protein